MITLSLDCETLDPDLKKLGAGAARNGRVLCMCARLYDSELDTYRNFIDIDVSIMRDLLEQADLVVGSNIQYDLDYLNKKLNLELPDKVQIVDVLVAERLLDTVSFRVNLDSLAKKYLGVGKLSNELEEYASGQGIKKVMENLDKLPRDLVAKYCYYDCKLALDVWHAQEKLIVDGGFRDAFITEIEVQKVIYLMTKQGIPFDVEFSKQLEAEMKNDLELKRMELESTLGTSKFKTKEGKKTIAKYCEANGVTYKLTTKKADPQFNAEFFTRNAKDEQLKTIAEYQELDKLQREFVTKLRTMAVGDTLYPTINAMKGEEGGAITGRFSCVTGETLVVTDKGYKRIDAISTGDKVLTHKGRYKKVTCVFRQGIQPTVTLALTNGHVLTCTKSHKLLQSNGRWSSTGTLLRKGIQNVYFKEAYTGQEAGDEGIALVQVEHPDAYGRHSYPVRSDISLGQAHNHKQHRPCNVRQAQAPKVLCFQAGGQKSYEGEEWEEAPQVERGSLRRIRVPDDTGWRQAHVCSSLRDDESLRFTDVGQSMGCAPHRWESTQQYLRQSSLVYAQGAQADTLQAEPPLQGVRVERSYDSGSREVFDIEVEEDHSYITAGVYSHNCTRPNVQQISGRNPYWSSKIRSQFKAPEGYTWVKMDYSQQEMRLLFEFASRDGGADAKRMVEMYQKDYTLDCYNMAVDLCRDKGFTITRDLAKKLMLATLYCMGPNKLSGQLGCGEEEAKELLTKFRDVLPFLRRFQRGVISQVEDRASTGKAYVETLSGRHVCVPIIEQEIKDSSGAIRGRRMMADGAYKAINYLIQGSAADILKMAMREIRLQLSIVPSLVVHDEANFLVNKDDVPSLIPQIVKIMENTYPLSIPMLVDVEIGTCWGDVQEYAETRDAILQK